MILVALYPCGIESQALSERFVRNAIMSSRMMLPITGLALPLCCDQPHSPHRVAAMWQQEAEKYWKKSDDYKKRRRQFQVHDTDITHRKRIAN